MSSQGLILRDQNFGRVLGASGVQNFFGDGYPYHKWLKRVFRGRFSFDGMTLVAKTTTLEPREGNMPLDYETLMPKELFPKCIYMNYRSWREEAVLNAVGLTGPGIKSLLYRNRWQQYRKPQMLSLMPLLTPEETKLGLSEAETRKRKVIKTREACQLLLQELPRFQAPVAIQMNDSCPNVESHQSSVEEMYMLLDKMAKLGIPIMPKFNIYIPIDAVIEISKHPACDAICISNTAPWDKVPEEDRMRYFGTTESPLIQRGFKEKGGVSGTFLFPKLIRWILDARARGLKKPINAGGGILNVNNARVALAAGAESIFLGSITMLRPWRLQEVIRAVNAS